jgi:hypothetical protein
MMLDADGDSENAVGRIMEPRYKKLSNLDKCDTVDILSRHRISQGRM